MQSHVSPTSLMLCLQISGLQTNEEVARLIQNPWQRKMGLNGIIKSILSAIMLDELKRVFFLYFHIFFLFSLLGLPHLTYVPKFFVWQNDLLIGDLNNVLQYRESYAFFLSLKEMWRGWQHNPRGSQILLWPKLKTVFGVQLSMCSMASCALVIKDSISLLEHWCMVRVFSWYFHPAVRMHKGSWKIHKEYHSGEDREAA